MKFEYEGVFFIGWVIRLVIFQQVSDYKFKVRHLFIIPILFTLVEYFFLILYSGVNSFSYL